MPGVAIIDGGGANLASLNFALERLGVRGEVTTDHERIRRADRVILPGVGAARDAMERLQSAGLPALIRGLTQPVLGICLGLQLLCESSAEDDVECLGVFPGRAEKFVPGPERPVPHMGWNRVRHAANAPLLGDIDDGAQFYFVHSYAAPLVNETLGRCDYGGEFSAVLGRDNFYATQFHPERSGAAGAQLLQNFVLS